jgi:CHASE3 domain sensor protein/nitrate/nitrite-specific signal transduction histidine kinase/ActR/RegA family two-component response regulator
MIRSTKIVISFAVVLVVIGMVGIASYINTQRLIKSNQRVIHTHEVMENLEGILSVLKDAETGQRGFILTGENRYLEPYDQALVQIETRLVKLTELTEDNPAQQASIGKLRTLTGSKLAELKQTVELRRQSGLDAAKPVILSDRGKKLMDDIRELVAQMQGREQELLRSSQNTSDLRVRWAMWTIVGGIPLSLLVLAIAAIALTHSRRSGDLIVGPPAEASTWQRIAIRYLFAVTMVALASILRMWLLNLGPMPLFITFYPAVLLVAMVSGGGPGIATTILSGLVTIYYFIPPYGRFAVESPGDVVALVIFSVTNLSLCTVAERLRRSRWAEAFGLAKQQEAEELAGKNEELSQQSEELTQQNEELQSQSEEIQLLNTELEGREDMLRKLLEATRLQSSEESVLMDICAAAKDIFGPPASAVVICEKKEDKFFIRAQAGSRETPNSWPIEGAFPELVMQERKTACLNDASLRPDLKLLQVIGSEPFKAALSSPLHVAGELFGAVTVYSLQKHEWTTVQFRLIEWFSTQCGHVLETLRLQEQLRQSEERFRMALRNAPVSVTVQDLNLRYIWAYNQRTAKNEDIVGKLDSDIFTPEEAAYITAMKQRVLAENTELREQIWLTHPTGRIFLDICWEPIRDEAGKVIGVGSATVDLTKIKLAEETLSRVNDELEQRVTERTAELAQRADQLRALTGELTLAEQRERSRLAKVLHDHLQQLLVAAKFRLTILGRGGDDIVKKATKEVEGLIDESILASRNLTAELSPPILHEAGLNAGLQWLARRMADKHGLFVELEVEDYECRSEQLKILLFESVRELLFNVVKHARTGSAEVSLRRVDDHLQVAVSDQGAGFDPNAMPAAGEAGRGLGLFAIRERLGFMGGTLQIQSAPGQGSRFILSVPVAPIEKVEPRAGGTLVLPEADLLISGYRDPARKIRLMLADDHAVVRRGFAAMLGAEPDIEIVGEAADGLEAIELARKVLPDIILMDMSMAKLNGIEATRIIHNEFPEIRIIGLSMFEEVERAQAMRDAGAVQYVAKSGAGEALIAAIRKHSPLFSANST